MNFEQFKFKVRSIKFGKRLPSAVYLHTSAVSYLPKELKLFILTVTTTLKINQSNWNIIKLSTRDFRLSLLDYPDFDQHPYPALHTSYIINLAKLTLRKSDYSTAKNPPILHRREIFLAPTSHKIQAYRLFTEEGEKIGLYENARVIGFKKNWERLIKRKGYALDANGHLKSIRQYSGQQIPENQNIIVERHKTAISRNKLSVPMFLLAQRGYLSGAYSILDYGCGRGDDLRELEAHGIDVIGWDPVHRPGVSIETCDIVNLGFVINVIEDKEERISTLTQAYSYSNKILIVSAMLGNEQVFEQFKAYKDGVITSRNTFQKYYMQGELQHFIENTLKENAIPLAPGVFAVFKNKIEEQKYLLERQRTRHQWQHICSRPVKLLSQKKSRELLDNHRELFDDFWLTCLELGRLPANDEFDQSELIRQIIGSHNKALTLCKKSYDEQQLTQAGQERKNDLLVYFALSHFNKRSTYSRMPTGLQRDIKILFGRYTVARDQGEKLLFSMSSVNIIYKACLETHASLPASQLNGQHDLIFHRQYLNQLPKELRVYVGCATQLYGDLDNVSLIKIHITSGKVSLMVYDDWEKDIPLLKERIKIKLRDQAIDFFDYYGRYQPPPLENKNIFIAPA